MSIEPTETVAIIALAGVVVSAVISGTIAYLSSRKSLYVGAVTSERMKWISELRALILEFQSGFFLHVLKSISNQPIEAAAFLIETQKLSSLENKLIIHLSGRGPIENNVLAIARSLGSAGLETAKIKNDEEKRRIFGAYGDLLALHSNFLFKQEWEKVKIEASGVLYAAYLRLKQRELLRKYEDFCRGEGYFVPIPQKSNHQFLRETSKKPRLFTSG